MKDYTAILIGNGTMGQRHRSRFEKCGVRFAKVLDVEASSWIESGVSNDFLEGLDFAVVASPASTHYKYAKFFLEHKIPVLVEKPLATNLAEVCDLVRLSRENETLLFVAQSECYNPIFLNFRKHLLTDLENAAEANKTCESDKIPLNVKLEFRREHGFSERCRDVNVALDLLVHDISLFLNLFDAKDVAVVENGCRESGRCECLNMNPTSRECLVSCDRICKTLKVVSGKFAGVNADFIADRNSPRDVRTISVEFGRNGNGPAFDYSVSLVRYTNAREVAHIPDSLDNEHHFFLKLLAGACSDWAERALMNAANAVAIALGEKRLSI